MVRKRKANLEVEYALERQVDDLKQEIAKLKLELREYRREDRIEKKEKKAAAIMVKKEEKSCPKCGAKINSSELPMGYLELCASACGYRAVTKRK